MTRLGPLVVLHDHLDGGVRPTTVMELAHLAGVATPTDDTDELAEWFTIRPSMSFEEAFSRFDLVIAATQTTRGLRRMAREAAEDLAADGVVHAELRFAPLNHVAGGLTPDEVMAAVVSGLADADDAGVATDVRLVVCAMRHLPEAVSVEAAMLAVRWMDRGVVGLDLAGVEVGHPAADHARAFALAEENGLARTVHAGEMDGVHQVADALDTCRPDRIGHGLRLIDDCEVHGGRIVELGPVARRVRDAWVPLEVCLTSNECLGTPVAEHPVRMLFDAGFAITLSADDRVITTTTTSREFRLAADVHGFDAVDLAACAERAAVAAFLPDADRQDLVASVRAGWEVRPSRLFHLVERERWEQSRGRGSYLPPEWQRDGFVHLSARHQLLTPANRFYRDRHDLVALELDAHFLSDAVVWEPGTGTAEHFPHLYGAITPDSVTREIPFEPSPDGSFLLPPLLSREHRGDRRRTPSAERRSRLPDAGSGRRRPRRPDR